MCSVWQAPLDSSLKFVDDMSFLTRWFADFGANPRYEIEARVKDIEPVEYEAVLAKLQALRLPCKAAVTVDESDSTTRRTYNRRTPLEASFMQKRKVERPVDVRVAGVTVRFSLTEEAPVAPPPSFAPTLVRIKDRHTFACDESVVFDLTRVRSGATLGDAERAGEEVEVEAEWCGHAGIASATPAWWAANFQYKVLFAVRHVLLRRAKG